MKGNGNAVGASRNGSAIKWKTVTKQFLFEEKKYVGMKEKKRCRKISFKEIKEEK